MGKQTSGLEYLNTYSSKGTVRTYKSVLRTFFNVIYGEGTLEANAERYFQEQRNYERDIETFFAQIKDMPPKTINLRLSGVRTFLIENKVELPQLFWRRLRRRVRGSRAVTDDKVPSNVELRKIMMNLPLSGRALFSVLSSSGMRIGEALKLTLDDIDLDTEPAKITIRAEYSKTGGKRITFISNEAKDIVIEWLKNREDYLKTSTGRSTLADKDIQDDRLFPFRVQNAYLIWKTALAKTGNDEKDERTGITKMRPQTLRKFFRSKMATLIHVDIVEA